MSGIVNGAGLVANTEPLKIPPPKPYAVFGTTGLRQTSGMIWEDYDPELRGLRAVKVYTRMALGDSTCGAILWAIEAMLRSVKWDVEPAKPKHSSYTDKVSPDAQEAADFLHEVLFDDMDTPWTQVISEALSCLQYGFSLAEKIYVKRDDGMIGIKDISPRPQDTILRWVFDNLTGDLLGIVQRHPIGGQELPIPIEKLLHFKVRNYKRSPEGLSIFRSAYKSWTYMQNLINIESIGLERDLAGLPIARIPGDIMRKANEGDPESMAIVQEFVRTVRDLRMNQQAGVVLASDPFPTPDGSSTTAIKQYDIELLGSTSQRAGTSDVIIRRHRGEIATAVLADFLFLGQQASKSGSSTGSYSLSADKSDLFMQSLEAVLGSLQDQLQRNLVAPLWALNGLDPDLRPTLRPANIAEVDAKSLADYVSKLAAAGARMFPDQELENDLRQRAGLPPLTDETIAAANQATADAMAARAAAVAAATGAAPSPGAAGAARGNGAAGPPSPRPRPRVVGGAAA